MAERLTEAEVRLALQSASLLSPPVNEIVRRLAREVLALMEGRERLQLMIEDNKVAALMEGHYQERIATLTSERDEARAVLREVMSSNHRCIGCVTFCEASPTHHPDCRLARALGEGS